MPKVLGAPAFSSLIYSLWKGETIPRGSMHEGLRNITINGKILDIGGARNPKYFSYFKKEGDVSIEIIDGKNQQIDFEKDNLPYADRSFDTAVCCNVLEHIFDHKHLVSEIFRITRNGGKLVGFVPFLIQYHPDPNDFFRYTHEALQKIFLSSGFEDIEISVVGGGPFLVNLNNICLMIPRIFRPIVAIIFWPLVKISVSLRPNLLVRYPLGYTFVCKKS